MQCGSDLRAEWRDTRVHVLHASRPVRSRQPCAGNQLSVRFGATYDEILLERDATGGSRAAVCRFTAPWRPTSAELGFAHGRPG
jgi:hypothetical protein